jgi:hypothetical protein
MAARGAEDVLRAFQVHVQFAAVQVYGGHGHAVAALGERFVRRNGLSFRGCAGSHRARIVPVPGLFFSLDDHSPAATGALGLLPGQTVRDNALITA